MIPSINSFNGNFEIKGKQVLKICACMGTHLHFVLPFLLGDNFFVFLFAFLNEGLSKWDLLLQERICSQGNKFFPLRDEPCLKGR